MSLTPPPESLKDFSTVIYYLDDPYHVSVSPFCWMNKWSHMQIGICAGDKPATNRATHFIEWKQWFDETTSKDVINKAFGYLMDENGAAILEDLMKEEQKLIDHYQKEAKEAAEQEKKLQAAEDAKFKSQGYTHKVIAWVHAGGDDYVVNLYCKGEPTKAQIQAQLKKKKSRVLDDYTVVVL